MANVKMLWRELRDLVRLLSLPASKRPVVVYSEDISSYIQFEGYLEELLNIPGRSVVYVTSGPDDPLFDHHHPSMSVYFARQSVSTWLPRVDSPVVITTVPDLGNLHVQRPGSKSFCLYVFHSLNSIHQVYRKGAFDNYDGFFCTGPHHKKELSTRFTQLGRSLPALYEVGYYKVDRIHAAHRRYRKRNPGKKTVVLAPSWGKDNLLEAYGLRIVEQLLRLNVRLVVRPHPCFFLPIYPGGREIVERIGRHFAEHPDVEIERTITSEDSFHEADLMVSDYSGAAYEYALGTGRPVLFVDVPRKVMNPEFAELGLPTFEDTMRYRVGRVLAARDIAEIDRAAQDLLARQSEYNDELELLRHEVIYNFGCSAEAGAQVIDGLLKERTVAAGGEK